MKKIICILTLVPLLIITGCAKKTPQDKLRDAEKLLEKGDILSAVILLEEVIEKHPNEPVTDDARILLARAHYLSNDLESCQKLLGEIFKKYGVRHPRGVLALNITLGIYAQVKKYDEGIKLITQTLNDTKTTGTLYWQLNFALADFYQFDKDTTSALAVLNKIAEQTTEEDIVISALEEIVGIYEANKNYTAAAKTYEDYLTTHPETKIKNILLGGMAYYYEKQNNKEKAEQLYAEAIAGFEKEIESAVSSEEKISRMTELAKLYSLKNEQHKSLEIFEKILKDYPNERQIPAIMLEMARIHSTLKQYDKSLSILNQVIQRWQRTPVADAAMRLMQQINRERAKTQPKDQPTTEPLSLKDTEKNPGTN
ncbi:MAG: tetratricopeptide repeat protein [Candidatus Sumerlaeia bacterium]|nr:tetratricopeptide repeat protein [Candidatus Sumerlaeia bacterium]